MPSSVFKFANNYLRDALDNYKPTQILHAFIDVAKYNHSAMIVNFLGDIIIPKFDFPYTSSYVKIQEENTSTTDPFLNQT